MAYLAKLKKGGNTYYYLVENIRVSQGVRKQLRKYLGKTAPSETKLQVLTSKFEEEVARTQKQLHGFHYLTKEEIREAAEVNRAFWKRHAAQSKTVQEQFAQNFLAAFVFNTNSIEGSTLTAKEVELLLEENISPNKPLDDVLEAKAAAKTFEFMNSFQGQLSQEFVLRLHELYFKETKPAIAGVYKKMQNRVAGSRFDTTPPQFVITDMKLYFQEYRKLEGELHPLELAAWTHWKLVRIHPFQDGNGRTARLIMNFILKKNGYAMIDIKTKEKQSYFKALEKCNYNNNARALAVRLVRRFKKQYQNALK